MEIKNKIFKKTGNNEKLNYKDSSKYNKANLSTRNKSSDLNSFGDSDSNLNLKINLTSENFKTTINNLSRKLSNSVSDQTNDFKNKTINTISSIESKENTLNFINRKNSHEFFLNSLRFNEKESIPSNNLNRIKKFSLTKPQSPKLRTKDRCEERNKKNLI